MGAKRIENSSAVDFRLALDRIEDRVISVLTRLGNLESASSVSFEYRPNWLAIEEGLAILENPEENGSLDLIPIGAELGRCAFSPTILKEILPYLGRHSVRLWLQLHKDLRYLPWEACYIERDSGLANGFLSQHPGTHLIRSVHSTWTDSKAKHPKTRVLIGWANPGSSRFRFLPGLEKEVQSIKQALSAPECRGFEVREVGYATPLSLLSYLEDWRPDVFHFVGHGERTATGCLIALQGGKSGEDSVLYGDDLALAISGAQVRLAILSGCFTGASASGMGDELVAKGMHAVVAMQAPINDASAGFFSRAFYGALTEGSPIEEAVHQGRSAIRGTGNDWAVPILFQCSDLDAVFDPHFDSHEAPAVRHNIPYDDRPFIGRTSERAEICQRIRIKHQRLVTVTGMGGMGKSRLGKKVSIELLDDFPDGVWMVQCDALASREDLLGAISDAIGIPNSGAQVGEVESNLVSLIGTRRLLLFLDCFEHLVDHADVIDHLLNQVLDLHVLVTSRILLGLEREFEFRLSPMTLSKKVTQASDSMTLFEEAAAHSVNNFVIDAKNRTLVRELCSELEGVPLALVLAAGRLRHLSLSELLDQVRTRPLEVLKRRGGIKDRHANIQRVVSDSFRLLGANEKTLLDKLSVFVGSFSSDDAADVCGHTKMEILDGLAVLRDNSLVQIQSQQDRTRYKLLDTVRQYIDQLSRGEEALALRKACGLRHAERYCRIADAIGEMMKEGRWTEGTTLLWADVGNFRAAAAYSARESRHELNRRFFDGLARLYFETNLYPDLEKLVTAGYQAAEALDDPGLASRIYGLDGALAACRKEIDRCMEIWHKRLDLCQSLGDAAGSADALTDMAWESALLGKIETGQNYISQALEISERVNSFGLIATCLVQKAQIALKSDDPIRAQYWAEEAEIAVNQSNEKDLTPFVYQNLALLNDHFGDLIKAKRAAIHLLKLTLEGHRYRGVSWTLQFLSSIHERRGDIEKAGLCLVTASKLNREIQTKHSGDVRNSLNQFGKRYPEVLNQLTAEYKKTPWRTLASSNIR